MRARRQAAAESNASQLQEREAAAARLYRSQLVERAANAERLGRARVATAVAWRTRGHACGRGAPGVGRDGRLGRSTQPPLRAPGRRPVPAQK